MRAIGTPMAVDATTPVGTNTVAGAIRKAAQATGTSFYYLLATARVESDLNPNLTMRSSTATGRVKLRYRRVIAASAAAILQALDGVE